MKWSRDGCKYKKSESTSWKAVCECNLLSPYALMYGNDENDDENNVDTNDGVINDIEDILQNITQSSNITTEEWYYSLFRSTELISNITQDGVIDTVNRTTAVELTNRTLELFDMLINQTDIWNSLNISGRTNSSTRLLQSVENLAVLMNVGQNENITTIEYDNIILQSRLFSIENDSKTNEMNFEFKDINLKLPIQALNYSNIKRSEKLVGKVRGFENSVISETPSDNMIASTASVLKNLTSYITFGQMIPNSPIISLTIRRSREKIELIKPYLFKFETKNMNPLQFGDVAQCSFWDMDEETWSNVGCHHNRMESNRTWTVCECNHLTDFAALADISGQERPSLVKTFLTYICSAISCLFLLASLFVGFRYNKRHYLLNDDQFKVKSNRYLLIVNLSFWLLISHLLILFGMDSVDNPIACSANSLILLFSLLTAFSFMLMLSTHLYLSTNKNYLFRYFPFRNYALFAYIFPLIIIVISIAIIYLFEIKNILETFYSLSGEYL